MSDSISYEEAIAYCQKIQPHWSIICKGLRDMRESKFGDLKKIMNTPGDNTQADSKILGGMVALDDILYEFETERPEPSVTDA